MTPRSTASAALTARATTLRPDDIRYHLLAATVGDAAGGEGSTDALERNDAALAAAERALDRDPDDETTLALQRGGDTRLGDGL